MKYIRAGSIGGQGLDDEPHRAQPLALNLAPADVVPALRGSSGGRAQGSSQRHSTFGSVARWRPRHSTQEQAAQHWLDSLAVRHDPFEWPDPPLCALTMHHGNALMAEKAGKSDTGLHGKGEKHGDASAIEIVVDMFPSELQNVSHRGVSDLPLLGCLPTLWRKSSGGNPFIMPDMS